MYNKFMEVFELINTYIKYVYILLTVVIIVLLICLFKALKPTIKTIEYLTLNGEALNKQIEEIKVKVEKIKYTLNNSVPLFAFLFFIFIVIVSAISDYKDTKKSKRSFTRSTRKQYKNMKARLGYKPSKKIEKGLLTFLFKTKIVH